MKGARFIPALVFLYLVSPCAEGAATQITTTEGTVRQPEKEIHVNIHSGLKTIPIRKVIGAVIQRVEEKGVDAINGSGAQGQDGVWDLSLTFMDKEKGTQRDFKWKYVRNEGKLTPLNAEAEKLSFPLSSFLFSTAIDMGLGMVEGQEVSPKTINGSAKKISEGLWEFDLVGLSNNNENFVQKWAYNSEEGELSPTQFDHSDLDKLLAKAVVNGKIDYTVVKNTPHLKDFLGKIAEIDENGLKSFPQQEQLAFWINAYNGIALKVMADNYPAMNPESIANTAETKRFKVAGEKLPLVQIRDDTKNNFKDDRVDFALFSVSGNPGGLWTETYCGRRLNDQLDRAAVASPRMTKNEEAEGSERVY